VIAELGVEERIETLAERDAAVRSAEVVKFGEDAAAPFGDGGEVSETQRVGFEFLFVVVAVVFFVVVVVVVESGYFRERFWEAAEERPDFMETDEAGSVRVEGGPDGLKVFEIFGGNDGRFAKDTKCDVVEDSGDEEVGEDVAHSDDGGDELERRAVTKTAVIDVISGVIFRAMRLVDL
jgi:hypothetical protein